MVKDENLIAQMRSDTVVGIFWLKIDWNLPERLRVDFLAQNWLKVDWVGFGDCLEIDRRISFFFKNAKKSLLLAALEQLLLYKNYIFETL